MPCSVPLAGDLVRKTLFVRDISNQEIYALDWQLP